MKNLMAILSILIMVFIFNSCGKEEAIPEQLEQETLIDLTGEWLGKDYECPFVDLFNIEERVRIVHNLKTGMVVATKITGDPCVPAGDITFHGYYSGTTSTFAAIFMAGSPTRPSSGGNNMTIDVYTSETLPVFTRGNLAVRLRSRCGNVIHNMFFFTNRSPA